jgi:hypothetical protein
VLPNVDGRSTVARRYRDIANAILIDQGGVDRCSESRQQLIRRFAAAAVLAEQLEGRLANGEEINIQEHATLSSTLVRLAARIGINRLPKDITELSLSAYIDRAYDSAEAVDAPSDADEAGTATKAKTRTSGRRKGRAVVRPVDVDADDEGDPDEAPV